MGSMKTLEKKGDNVPIFSFIFTNTYYIYSFEVSENDL